MNSMLHTPSGELTRELDRALMHYDLVEHRRTRSAHDEAAAIGVRPQDVAKTIVVASGDRFVRAVLPASEKLELRKVRRLLGDKHARLATEAELAAAYPLYELGAVPPFGPPLGDRVLFDWRLVTRDTLVLEAGAHDESLRLKTVDLVQMSDAELADIAAGEHG